MFVLFGFVSGTGGKEAGERWKWLVGAKIEWFLVWFV